MHRNKRGLKRWNKWTRNLAEEDQKRGQKKLKIFNNGVKCEWERRLYKNPNVAIRPFWTTFHSPQMCISHAPWLYQPQNRPSKKTFLKLWV